MSVSVPREESEEEGGRQRWRPPLPAQRGAGLGQREKTIRVGGRDGHAAEAAEAGCHDSSFTRIPRLLYSQQLGNAKT